MNSSMKQIKRRRLTDQIADQLVSLIGSGKLRIGQRLPPDHQLMKQLGVGRSSLREAIGALLLMGVLTARPGHGTYVSVSSDDFMSRTLTWRVQMGREKIEELVEARIVLEQSIVGLAAARAKEADIVEIRYAQDQLKSVKKNQQKGAQIQADLSFHFALAKASHNATLFRFLSELHQLMLLWMKQTVRTGSIYNTPAIIKHHEEILSAVEAHHVEKARSALRRHLETSANNLSSILLHKQFKSGLS